MDFLKRLVIVKNALGFTAIGLLFAIFGGFIAFSGGEEDILLPIVFIAVGIIVTVFGIIGIKKGLTESTNQYDRTDKTEPSFMTQKEDFDFTGEKEFFVYHFTGKLNQSQVMKDSNGNVVYEAVCDGIKLIKDTGYNFIDRLSGEESKKMISHTLSKSIGDGDGFSVNISSSFNVDKVPVWDIIAKMGYGFKFGMNGLTPHYTVQRYGTEVGYIENGGTGLMNPKYKDNPLGKVPTSGIFKVYCSRADIPGFFMICFALSRTDTSLN